MKHGLNLPEEVKLPFILLVFDSPFFVKSILFHISHEIMLCLCIIVIYLVDLKVQVILKSNTSFPFPLLPRIGKRSHNNLNKFIEYMEIFCFLILLFEDERLTRCIRK